MKKIKGLFLLVRFELPLAAGICVVMGQLFAYGRFSSLFLSGAGFISVFLISASTLVMNDFFDIETDKINAPHRPIPSKLVSPYEALTFAFSLLFTGLVISYFINLISLVICLVLSLIGFLYNRFFKKTGLPGNLMVSFSVGMTFIYGGATVELPFDKVVLFFGLISALIDLGEEIAADAMDAQGDKLINSKSIALRFGKLRALKISFSIFSTVIILTIIPFLLSWFSPEYLLPILVMDISVAYFANKLMKSDETSGRKYIRWIYLGATGGLVIFLVMHLLGI